MGKNPTIVVVAYNRPSSLRRLLGSLEAAEYPGSAALVISIDRGDSRETAEVAHDFEWKAGSKRIIERDRPMGLRQHILACGDLTRELGTVIMLEDDLYVSPHFYHYALQATNFYKDSDSIAGISLYAPACVESSPGLPPFTPLREECFDTYLMQLTSSWGQAWTPEQWNRFKRWYDAGDHAAGLAALPALVREWPETSWKKYFNAYLLAENRYFAYPYESLTTNFGDAGEHHQNIVQFQVPLERCRRNYRLKPADQAVVVYDSHGEIDSEYLADRQPELDNYDFDVDLYGSKQIELLTKRHILTTRPVRHAILSFGLEMRPPEMNVILGIKGNRICLAETRNIMRSKISGQYFDNYVYFHNASISIRYHFMLVVSAFLRKIFR